MSAMSAKMAKVAKVANMAKSFFWPTRILFGRLALTGRGVTRAGVLTPLEGVPRLDWSGSVFKER